MKPLGVYLRQKVRKKAASFKTFRQQHSRRSFVLGIIALCSGIALFVFFVLFVYIWVSLPDISDPNYLVQAKSSIIYDSAGNELYVIHADQNRKLVSYENIPETLRQATIAIEDDEFFEHLGIDIGGLTKAVCHEIFGNLGGFCPKRGGSTITQQLARNIYLDRSRSYIRKLKEIILSFQIERKYNKDKILELYLNLVPYGNNAYGVGAASTLYFGKSSSGLTLTESAVLAALPNAPSRYSPYGSRKYSSLLIDVDSLESQNRVIESEQDLDPQEINRGLLGRMIKIQGNKVYIRGRVDLILRRMLDLGMIDEEEKNRAWTESQLLTFSKYREPIRYPHFVFYVKEQLERKYGKEIVEQGGLKVYTSINPKIQAIAEESIEYFAERNEISFGSKNESLVAIDPRTGHILAMVGSRDYFDTENDGNVNVTLSPRLPGSSFKPFAYAAAFLRGYAPATVLWDVETDFGGGYKPRNYDGRFVGPVSMRKALGRSLNIPAVKAGILAGIPNVIDLAKRMGIQFFTDEGYFGSSLSLGAGEVRLLDIVSAYGVFASGGVLKKPVSILKITDYNDAIIEEWRPDVTSDEPVISPQLAYLITHVLSDSNARAGWNSRLQLPGRVNAAKTGTANKKKNNKTVPADAWTIGYTPDLVAGVWSGNNDGSPLYANANGFDVAATIWHRFMTQALKGTEATTFPVPEGIRKILVSDTSGLLVTKSTPPEHQKTEIFADFNIPSGYDQSFQEIEVDKFSKLLASDECPVEAREKKIFFRPLSVRSEYEGWQNPIFRWMNNNKDNPEKFPYELAPKEPCVIQDNSDRFVMPTISIVSPEDKSFVGFGGVGVWVQTNSSKGVREVQYFLDDAEEPAFVSTKHPYKGSISFPSDIVLESHHSIRARVIDYYYNSAEDNVEIVVSEDNDAPFLGFVYPHNNQTFSAGDLVEVKIEARDSSGDIASVSLFLDDKLIEIKRSAPYTFTVSIPQEEGVYDFVAKAVDNARNESQENLRIEVTPSHAGQTNNYILIREPRSSSSYRSNQHIPFVLGVPASYALKISRIDVYALISGRTVLVKSTTIEAASSGIGTISLSLPPILPVGEVSLYAKITLRDGEVKLSSRRKVVIEE